MPSIQSQGGSSPRSGPSPGDDRDDDLTRFMEKHGTPVTVENYLNLAYAGERSLEDLGAEEIEGFPGRIRELLEAA